MRLAGKRMFLGHFALGFAAKRLEPSLSLGSTFAAAQLPDLLWPALVLAGLERIAIAPGDTAFTPLRFESYPYSHSLVPATLALELAMYGAGILLYAKATRARDGRGRCCFGALAVLLVVVYLASAFGPPPPGVTALGLAGLGGGALFWAWAGWADRHREARVTR